jgi:ABC-type uncharacterized transport system auxiliary subunit
MSARALLSASAAAALAVLASGCISIGGGDKDEPPPAVYTLNAPASGSTGAPTSKGGILIAVPKPELPPAFDSARIALMFEEGRRFDYYAGAKWSARLDELLQQFIIDMAPSWLPGVVLQTPDVATTPRYKLVVTFTDFQPVYAGGPDSPPRLEVSLTMALVPPFGSSVKAQATARHTVPAAANTQTAVTQGLQDLLEQAVAEAFAKLKPQLGV